jgi:HEAT repeat protein
VSTTRCCTLSVLLLSLLLCGAGPKAPTGEDGWLEVLKSGTPAVEKNNACRQLKLVGTEKSVPALAALLVDPELSHPARLALESIPCEAAGAALRIAAGKATGLTRSGILDSLGERRDAAAVPVIAPALDDPEPQVMVAAAWALGKIGTADAARALAAARAKAQGDRRAPIGQGLVLCADNLLRAGKTADAATIYGDLSQPGELRVVRIGALRGVVQSAGPQTVRVVREFLASNDPLIRAAGAGGLPTLSTADLRAVAADLGKLPAVSQRSLLAAVGIRGDRALLPVAVEALGSPDEAVCLAAIQALGAVGDAAVLPKLLPLAAKEGPVAEAARRSIESLGGPGTDDKIIGELQAEMDPQRRAGWIGMLGSRRSAGAVGVLLEEARHAEPVMRQSAMTALARLAAPKHVPGLIAGVLRAEKGPERDNAEKAVMLVCQQIKDPAKRVEPVLAEIGKAPEADKAALLPLVGRIGGPQALTAIVSAMESNDPKLYEAGLRGLCNWPDASVAERLLSLAEEAKDSTHRVWALRALVRVISLPGPTPDAEKLAKLNKAMQLATRDEERALVLERAAAVRNVETLRFVLPYLDQPALAEAACKAVADLAHHREVRDPNQVEFRPALEKVLRVSKDPAVRERVQRYLQTD